MSQKKRRLCQWVVHHRQSPVMLKVYVNLTCSLSNTNSLHVTTAPRGPGPSHYRGFQFTLRQTDLVVLLWTRYLPVAETSTWQHTILTRDRHPCPGGIRTRSPSKRASAHPRLRPLGHWGCLLTLIVGLILITIRDIPTVGRRISVPRLTAW